jgi:6-phosphogluconate dehydrogenase
MKRGYNLDDNTIQKYLRDWNEPNKSYLIEITGQILKKTDTDGQKLSDWAKSKGTGKWTSQMPWT